MTMPQAENTPQRETARPESLDLSTSSSLRELALEAGNPDYSVEGNQPVAFSPEGLKDDLPFTPTDFPSLSEKNLTIPTIFEKTHMGGVQYDIFSRIFKDGTIFLVGPVETGMATLITSQLMYWSVESPEKEITIHLNSPGGSVTDGLAIYDTIQQISNPVSIIVSGQACSMGAVLLSGGEKGKRYAQPNARVMIHSVRGGAGGIAADVKAQSHEMDRLNEQLTRIIADNCGKPFEEVQEDMRQDYFMGAEEALAYGIIDGIVHPDGSVTRRPGEEAKKEDSAKKDSADTDESK